MSDLPHACRVLPDAGPPAIAVTGDLHAYPVLIANRQTGVLSHAFELAGNGIYCLNVTPVATPADCAGNGLPVPTAGAQVRYSALF